MIRRNPVGFIGAAFLAVGLCLLAGCGYVAIEAARFSARAERAEGIVIALERAGQADSARSTARPVVRYVTREGTAATVTGRIGSAPPAFAVGEAVGVLYDPADPGRARLATFLEVWFVALVLGGLGTVFAAIGGVARAIAGHRRRIDAWLQRHGHPVRAQIADVYLDRVLRVNGRRPYRISARWHDPRTGRVHLLVSAPIWIDPQPYLAGRTELSALVDPARPARHRLDLSFLPQPG